MKVTKVILLFFVMLLVSVEVFTMPTVNNSNNKGGNEAQRSNQTKVPAWLNANNGFAGMNTGGGTKTVQQSRYYHPPAPTPTVNNSNNKGGNEQRNKVPAWMNGGNGFSGMNTGGGTKTVQQSRYYHPPAPIPTVNNSNNKGGNEQRLDENGFSGMYTGGGTTVQQPTYDAPGVMLGSGEAPGNTMSDYLRSLYANNLAMSDPYAQPSGYGGYGNGYGFGSRYGGNWGGGGGDWGGGGGGGGYDSPAWLNYLLSLYSWNIR